ncbi:MAG: DJ-1/PfpI family protein [Deinococcota bacterium]
MSDKKVLLLLYPHCISFEAMLAVEILGQKYCVEVVTLDGELHTDASGLQIKPQIAFDGIQTDDYVALIVPGGNPDGIIGEARVQHLIHRFYSAQLILAGICAGVLVLADSGVLRGHDVTHNYTERCAPKNVVELTSRFWEGSRYKDSLCLESGNIITALPNGYVDFATTLAERLGVYSAEQAVRMNQYY